MDKRIKVNEDCTLYENPRSRFIYADIRMPDGNRTRVSTKKLNFADAQVAALAMINQMKYAADYGLTYQTKLFKDVAATWLKKLDNEVQLGLRNKRQLRDYKGVTDRFLVGFFGKKKIDTIKASDIAAFWEWHKRYWVDGPGSKLEYIEYERDGKIVKRPVTQQLKKVPSKGNKFRSERTALKQIFDFAVTNEWVKSGNVPPLTPVAESKSKKGTKSRRPAFSLDEIDTLFSFARSWIDKGRNDRERWYRELLYDYITILFHTGIRTGKEALNLRWRDCEFKEDKDGYVYVVLRIDGKTGERIVPFSTKVVHPLERLIARRREYQVKNDKMFLDEISQRNERIFVLRDGKEIDDLDSTWNRLLKDSGLALDQHGTKRPLYSLRHTFATERLENGKIEPYMLAEWMGTSVTMLKDHYSHIIMANQAKYLHRVVE